MIPCLNCGYQNPEGATHCEACYTSLDMAKNHSNCPNCGATLQQEANFCSQCGFKLVQTSPNFSPANMIPSNSSTNAQSPPSEGLVATQTPESSDHRPDAKKDADKQPKLLHLQTNAIFSLANNLTPICLGKPNEHTPPDVDLSGLPDSDIISRVHARIIVQEGNYYLEDAGSSNGTYLNNKPIKANKLRALKPGDKISLGKGDLVTFLFQLD